MSSSVPPARSGAVFLSYASQDAEAAKRICVALRAADVEVWFDQSELRGGDAWDANIRKQIRECALFLPVISAHTDAREEGYFRREWNLAVQRTLDMAHDKAFLVPVVIDATSDAAARVPDKFREVQWTRLRLGETNLAFCERVQRLLDRSAVNLTANLNMERGQIDRATPQTAPASSGFSPESRARRWLIPGLCAAGAAVALVLWQPWRHGGAPASPPAKPAAGPSLSEARKLAAKADALFEQGESAERASLVLAEQYCKQAIALDPNDAEVWAVYARVTSQFIFAAYDNSPERRNQASEAASRSVRLAPESFEARFARAYFLRMEDATFPEAEQMLRQLIEERPIDKRVWRVLGQAYVYATRAEGKSRSRWEEAVECFRRAIALPGGDQVSLIWISAMLEALDRFDEAEQAMKEALARDPVTGPWALRAKMLLMNRGDVAAAREAVLKVPASRLHEDYNVFVATQVWWCAREPDKVIELLRNLPRDSIAMFLDGPKAVLMGDAHRLAGRTQAAEVEWRAALQVVERRLAAEPNHLRSLVWKARLHAVLGEAAQARRSFQTAEELGLSPRDSYWAAGIALELGDLDKAVSLLTAALDDHVLVKRPFLRVNPTWDRLHGHPRFEALVAEPVQQTSEVRSQKSEQDSAKPDPKSIAVLAFENLSGDKENEYFSDGVSEELLNVLGRVPGLRVAARTSAFSFKGSKVTAQEIGQKLGVAHLVEGTVRRAGTKVRIAARLSRAATGEQVWGESYEKELKDIFALQDEIARDIAQKLQLTLGDSLRPAKPVDPEAHRLVLQGRYYWNLRTDEGFAQAEVAFNKALQIDPQFARAHSALAGVVANWAGSRTLDGVLDIDVDLARAKAAAQRAIALDRTLAEPYTVLGSILMIDGELAEAERHLQTSLKINPNDANTHHWRAMLQAALGRLDIALEESNTSVQMDPFLFILPQTNARYLVYLARFAEALVKIEQVLVVRPEFIPARGLRARILLALGRTNDAVGAARAMRRDLHLPQRWSGDSDAIAVLRQAGLTSEAADYAAEVMAALPPDNLRRGPILATLGRFDEALVAYGSRTRLRYSPELFWDTRFDPIRDDARFQQLLVKLGCVEEYKVARATLARMLAENRMTEIGGQKSEVSGKAATK